MPYSEFQITEPNKCTNDLAQISFSKRNEMIPCRMPERGKQQWLKSIETELKSIINSWLSEFRSNISSYFPYFMYLQEWVLPPSLYFLLSTPRPTETGTGIIVNTSPCSVMSGVHSKHKIQFIFSLISFSEISSYLFFFFIFWFEVCSSNFEPSKMAIVRVLYIQFHQIQSNTALPFQLCIIFWCCEWNVI